jgi:hypothetical protein
MSVPFWAIFHHLVTIKQNCTKDFCEKKCNKGIKVDRFVNKLLKYGGTCLHLPMVGYQLWRFKGFKWPFT